MNGVIKAGEGGDSSKLPFPDLIIISGFQSLQGKKKRPLVNMMGTQHVAVLCLYETLRWIKKAKKAILLPPQLLS